MNFKTLKDNVKSKLKNLFILENGTTTIVENSLEYHNKVIKLSDKSQMLIVKTGSGETYCTFMNVLIEEAKPSYEISGEINPVSMQSVKSEHKTKYTPYQTVGDNTKLKFGKYKGKPIKDIPAQYLQWLIKDDVCKEPLKGFLKQNEFIIKFDAQRK